MKTATLRLFNAIQIDRQEACIHLPATLERTIRNGYVLDPAIQGEDGLLDTIESVIGISGEKANAAFHKSWSVVRDSSMEFLVIQQIIHYLTTYGFEQLGIYQKDAVYIPSEILEIPSIQENIPLVVIRAMDAQEILAGILHLASGIALSQQTIEDLLTIIKANGYDSSLIQQVGNRELKGLLYDYYHLVPYEPVEFLRYLISKLTNESLLIKNEYMIEKIKQSDGKILDAIILDSPDDLASIFLRFKPLFLAMKTISTNKNYFNQLRKKANKMHKPISGDYLSGITAQLKSNDLDLTAFQNCMSKTSIFRKIRLAYALKHRIHASDSIVYRIRNGSGWACSFEWPVGLENKIQQALDIVLSSIVSDIRKNVEGKTIYIPSNIHYALPATEKQFTGNLPSGTYFSVPEDIIVGIHWMNKNKRIDLDLSVISESGKIGWDSVYRSAGNDVLFSGDVTDAPEPNGASEFFYIQRLEREAMVLMTNYYNFQKGDEIDAKIIIAHEKPMIFSKNYLVDVNNLLASANIKITKKQNILGLLVNIDGENRMYFANVSIGNSITSSGNEHSTHARKYLVSRFLNSLELRAVLSAAGANVVEVLPDGDVINLSPASLDKTTLIELIKPHPDA